MVLVCHMILQDHIIKGPCEFMGRSPSRLSYHPAKFGSHWDCQVWQPQATWQQTYNGYLSCDLARKCNQNIRLYGLQPLKVCHHSSKFGAHRGCESGDIMVLVCDMILQDHVIKGSCDFMDGRPWQVTTLPRLVAIGIVVVEI